jgi:hypothetical protein
MPGGYRQGCLAKADAAVVRRDDIVRPQLQGSGREKVLQV